MKVKELQKTVATAWSPLPQNPILMAAGTAAQQLDTNASSVLEIYSNNFKDPGYDLELKASQASPYRFQKIVWSPTGFGSTHPNGLIVGGCEGGHLMVYSASRLLAGEEGLIASQDKHTGAIRGLDFNPFQHNLLASVASESEIFIWDLNNTTTPMTPGTKSQPLEDIQNVAWNKQVQHILASVFSTRCVIWDLRKNEQIIKLSDTQSRVRWRALQWHPEIATQLWLASEDDQSPVVQLWDLRYATTPAKTFQIHQRGILGLTWCPVDTDLMVSCGKDNKIYCWNPNTELPEGEILSEVATTGQWYNDVQWCPRNPALIASSSLDGNVSIYSLYGGTQQQVQTSNKIADSFPGMDNFAQAPIPQQTTQVVYSDLKRAPKWLKRPAAVSFGFGGRLLSFNQNSKTVAINQIITEPELVERANSLEKTLDEGNYMEYCRQKADQMTDQHGRFLWYFLKANFEINPREEMLNLLGYNKDDVSNKFQKLTKEGENHVEQVTDRLATLTHGGDNNALFDAIATGNKTLQESSGKKLDQFKIPTGDGSDGLIAEAILSGNIEAAVELCIESDKPAEALIIASTAGIDFLAKTQERFLRKQNTELSNIISALVSRDWNELVSRCSIDSWKEALMAVLTHSDGQFGDLCAILGERLQGEEANISLARNAILCYICAGNLEKLVEGWLQLKQKERNDQNLKLSTVELQELVEIVMLLKKSLELRGNVVEPAGKLAEFLSQYAGLLAAQGALDTALGYLGPTEDPELEDLRERLYYALGHKKQPQRGYRTTSQSSGSYYGQHQQQQTPIAASNRFNQPRGSFSNTPLPATNAFNPGVAKSPPQPPQPWNSIPPVANVPTPQVPLFNPLLPQNPVPSQPQSGFAQTAPPKPPLVNDALSHPQRPSSVGSQGNAPLSRSKYILDPSVASAPAYGQNMGAYNPAPISQANSSQFNPSGFNTNPMSNVPASSYQPVPTFNQGTFKPFAPTPTGSISSVGQPGNYLPGIPPIETAQPAYPPPPMMANRNPTPPPGWNDPPPLQSHRPQQQPKSEPPAPLTSPITHPLFGVDPNQNQNGYNDPNAQFQPPPMQSSQQIPFASQQNNNQFPNQTNFQTSAVPQVYKPQGYNENQAPVAPQQARQEPPKEKPPLPEEFIYLQTVLEELKAQCLNAAPDPRTKRKFVDVGKRLESLYDALREGRLAPSTLSALNQIVQYIQIGDYGNALATHTMIVSGPDFSQTASFMPGIKVMVQSAADLSVYLR